jgi:hypothetical protein
MLLCAFLYQQRNMNVTEAKVGENISLDLYPMALQSLKNLDLRENISLQELNKYQMFHKSVWMK